VGKTIRYTRSKAKLILQRLCLRTSFSSNGFLIAGTP
jgi:hypothetical protein